ncbi:xanthine/uracil permease family protein [Salmonella enterica subsp. arizonae]|uniref:Xanthine/uracil permease family protein n=1 Tax=Salmonella enterica subsp. arizonae TaxID=59203 RepID=A0A379TKE5_SALER|nr:xanthine/uracil permease family protein [Salmonella enterica subsp. arizonae]
MSQQHTTQASGQGMLERVFKLREHGTTARTEVIAGFTTFLTMVYIVFVNPQILGVAGMDTSAVFVTTCLIAAFGSILMGLFANLPVALAPAMGVERFFRFCRCPGDGAAVASWNGRDLLGRYRTAATDHFPRALLDDRQHSG